jgi:hypothetical protein
MPLFSTAAQPTPRRFSAALRESLLRTQLTTIDNCPTKTLITQNLDPLSPISNSPSGALAGMR